jgi:hypothetical protein
MNLPRPLACSLADTLRRGFRLDVDARFRPLGGDHMRILWPPEYHRGLAVGQGLRGSFTPCLVTSPQQFTI